MRLWAWCLSASCRCVWSIWIGKEDGELCSMSARRAGWTDGGAIRLAGDGNPTFQIGGPCPYFPPSLDSFPPSNKVLRSYNCCDDRNVVDREINEQTTDLNQIAFNQLSSVALDKTHKI